MDLNKYSKSDRIFIGVLILVFCVIAMSIGITMLRMGPPVWKLLGVGAILSGIYGVYKVVEKFFLNKKNKNNGESE